MSESGRCCEITRNDLNSAHKQLAKTQLQVLLLKAHVDSLTIALADVTLERDNLLRAQAAATIQQIQEEAA